MTGAPTLDCAGATVANPWVIIRDAAAQGAELGVDSQDVIVPLPLWQSERDQLRARKGRVGVWLDADADPLELADSIALLPLIAVNFPAPTDGRGLSVAVLLRTRLNFSGELRAIGDVRQDQLSYMRRCGFTTFTPAAGADLGAISDGLVVMSDYYQASVDEPLPLFRRRTPAASG